MKHNNIIIFIALAFLTTACELDYMPLSDQSELTMSTNSDSGDRIKYKDRAAIEAVYKNLYTLMRDRQEHWYLDYLLLTEVRADNAYAGTTGAEVVPVETNSLDASNSVIARDWDRYLSDIASANSIICNIDSVPDPAFAQSERDQWKAEAKIFRAMMMYDMVRFFGYFPVITTEAPDITADNIEDVYPLYFPMPSTPAKTYAQITKDLTEAIPHAPALNAGDKTKLSKTVARALLAKVYADKVIRDYDKCLQYCNEVLADGIDLEPVYGDLFEMNATQTDAKLRNSQETILEIQYFSGSGNWVSWMFGRNLANYEENFTWAKWVTPSRDLINAFDTEKDNVRKAQSIVYYSCGWANYYPSDNYPFAYKCRSGVNSIIKLRGSDIFLLKAEALAHQGQLNDAVDMINKVRKRAKLSDLTDAQTANQETLLNAILNERRLELAFEGHRWFDLVRFGKMQEVMNNLNQRDSGRLPQNRTFTENLELMPIPQTALDQNSNLVQNPGY